MRILLTGFQPFEGAPTNCTELVIRQIEQWQRSAEETAASPAPLPHAALAHELHTAVLPVADRTAVAALDAAMDRVNPECVIALGEAAGRSGISIERLAINLRDYRIPDNEGVVIANQPVIPNGPAAYFATLPLERIRFALQSRSVPSRLSRDAGTFLCNQVMYALLHRAASTGIAAGFLHLPLVRQQLVEFTHHQRHMPKPGPGVSDAVAADGTAIELNAASGLYPFMDSAPDLNTLTLAVLDAIHACTESRCDPS